MDGAGFDGVACGVIYDESEELVGVGPVGAVEGDVVIVFVFALRKKPV